jgi:phage shock protein C
VNKQLTRDPNDKIIAGVASGLADYFGIDTTIVRVLFLLLLLPGGLSPLLYVVLWIVMPERPALPPVGPSDAEPYRFDPCTGEPLSN